jgi:hypothetical protein
VRELGNFKKLENQWNIWNNFVESRKGDGFKNNNNCRPLVKLPINKLTWNLQSTKKLTPNFLYTQELSIRQSKPNVNVLFNKHYKVIIESSEI